MCFMVGVNVVFMGEKMFMIECNGWDDDVVLFECWGL